MKLSKDLLELIIKACAFVSEFCSYALEHFALERAIKPEESGEKKDGI